MLLLLALELYVRKYRFVSEKTRRTATVARENTLGIALLRPSRFDFKLLSLRMIGCVPLSQTGSSKYRLGLSGVRYASRVPCSVFVRVINDGVSVDNCERHKVENLFHFI